MDTLLMFHVMVRDMVIGDTQLERLDRRTSVASGKLYPFDGYTNPLVWPVFRLFTQAQDERDEIRRNELLGHYYWERKRMGFAIKDDDNEVIPTGCHGGAG